MHAPSWLLHPGQALKQYDPGYQRAIHAARTVLAVIICIGLFWRAPVQTRIFAGVCPAFLLQCIGAGSRRYQQWCMVLSALAMALLVFAGAMLDHQHHLGDALVILTAAGAFYVRRLLPDHSPFPLFVFSSSLLAVNLPAGWPQAGYEVLTVLVALAVAFPLAFYVLELPRYPAPKPPVTMRTVIRAGLAALLATLITNALQLPRSYWAVLAAVVVMSETLGSGLKFGLQRLGMTILGCVAGWLLTFLAGQEHLVRAAIMLTSVALAVFFRNASYPWMIFFITLYVAFLFAAIGEWTASIAWIRVYETAIGCGVAMLTMLLVPPKLPSTQ